jgi:hypothetical protein
LFSASLVAGRDVGVAAGLASWAALRLRLPGPARLPAARAASRAATI